MTIRDSNKFCCYCGKRFSFSVRLTSDHLIPLSKGGTNSYYNKRNCCSNCNASKRSYYPEQWLKLLEKRKTRLNRQGTSLYDIEIQIENLKYIIEYVQSAGDKIFENKHFYERYLDRRNAVAMAES